MATTDKERQRLEDMRQRRPGAEWRRWGPYVSARAWGTVREDYSPDGRAWDFLPHDWARSKTYRWNEDGLAAICDDEQRLCFGLALWNGQDPILKERPFGLSGPEGNHGEDVKEYYFFQDNLPSHAYMKMLYKYPQAAFPYEDLVKTNAARTRHDPEYELLDTGVFADNRYWDVTVEYAKASPDDILIQITAANRGPDAATLEILPTLWYRNVWAWGWDNPKNARPEMKKGQGAGVSIEADHAELGPALPALRGHARPAVHRERDQRQTPLRRGQPHALRQGRHQRLHRRRHPGRGQPRPDRHQSLRPLPSHRRGRRRRRPSAFG